MSVRKRTWKTAAGEAKEAWVVDYAVGGKRRLKTFKRKKEADAFETRSRFEITQGTHTPDSASITVAEAAEKWIEACRARGLERSTIDAYAQHTKLHIGPFLGRLKLSQISAPGVREFEDRIRLDGRSPAMVRKILTSLGSLLSDAQERGLVSRNVVRELGSRRKKGVDRRADRRQKGRVKVGVEIPSREEIRAIVAALQGRWRPIILTAIFTGLRASELRGLRWADVDLKKGELHVRQRADRYNVIGRPKSESGERTVPLPPIVANALRELKLARSPKSDTDVVSDTDIVFASSGGRIQYHSNLVKYALIPAQIAAGITTPDGNAKYPGLHALRHFYASWCINRREDGGLGLTPKLVQERLGHSTIGMTLDVYGHLFPRGDDGSELAAAEKSLYWAECNINAT
jgi:integrase